MTDELEAAAAAERERLFGDYSQGTADDKPNPRNAYPSPKPV